MQHQDFDVPSSLQHLVLGFWSMTIDSDQQAQIQIMPDGHVDLVFYVGGPCFIARSESWQPLTSPFLIGLLEQPVRLQANNRVHCLGIKCYPWMVFELFDLPINQVNPSLLNHALAQLQANLSPDLQAGEMAKAVTKIIQYLLEVSAETISDKALTKVGQVMQTASGTLPIRQIADVAHLTVRTLERRFKRATGYPVKQLLSLMRFERVYGSLWAYPQTNLASLAHDLGYADQAHLSREFKRYSGTTPAVFAQQVNNGNPSS